MKTKQQRVVETEQHNNFAKKGNRNSKGGGMMQEKGKRIVCDRCGKETFVKTTGEGEMDGGYTRWNKFEEAKGWDYIHKIGDLCPECLKEWDEMQERFKQNVKEWVER